jgi:hypothetical protein
VTATDVEALFAPVIAVTVALPATTTMVSVTLPSAVNRCSSSEGTQ